MVNQRFVDRVKEGAESFNAWRLRQGDQIPDLSGADLADLNLSDVDLHDADLSEAILSHSDLSDANLKGADLIDADLTGVRFANADLGGANLTGADLSGADFSDATLTGAFLTEAKLVGATFCRTDLSLANFSLAELRHCTFQDAVLLETIFSRATVGYGSFAQCDLSSANGLESVIHSGPTSVGVDTLWMSGGVIPEQFLRGSGIPDELIKFLPSLIGSLAPIQFYSCFISYSHQDEAFCKRLHSRLQQEKLRVWYAPEDLLFGRKIHEEIDAAIRVHDKLLLVLSDESMKSKWVATEIRKARKREIAEQKRVLFPISLVPFNVLRNWELFNADEGLDLATEIREYLIPDFSHWKDHDSFESGLKKLLESLKAAGSEPGSNSRSKVHQAE